jgi:hypothetical protein
MTDQLRERLAATVFKGTQMTVGEAILVQGATSTRSIATMVMFVMSRVDREPSCYAAGVTPVTGAELHALTLSEFAELIATRVMPGVASAEKASDAIGKLSAALGVH